MIDKHSIIQKLLVDHAKGRLIDIKKNQNQGRCYQRSKQDVEQELLAFCSINHKIKKIKKEKQQHQIMNSHQLQCKQQMKTHSNCQSNLKHNHLFDQKIMDELQKIQIQLRQNSEIKTILPQKKQFMNQYFKTKSPKQKDWQDSSKLQQSQGYLIINNFMREVNLKNYEQKNSSLHCAGKNDNNDSTMALSKFYKPETSPVCRIKKNQISPNKNGCSLRQNKQKSPIIIKNRKQKIKGSALIVKNNVGDSPNRCQSIAGIININTNSSKRSQGKIVKINSNANSVNSSEKKSHKINLQYSNSIQREKQYDQLSNFQLQLSNEVKPKMIQSYQQNQDNLMQSSQVTTMFRKTNEPDDQNIKKVFVDLNKKCNSCKIIKQKKKEIAPAHIEITNQEQLRHSYKQDDQDVQYFDRLLQANQNKQSTTSKDFKQMANDFKKSLGIKNQKLLKEQISNLDKKWNQKKISQNVVIKEKEKGNLFNSCQEKTYRKGQNLKTQKQSISKQQINKNKAIDQNKAQLPILSYLFNKISNLRNQTSNASKTKSQSITIKGQQKLNQIQRQNKQIIKKEQAKLSQQNGKIAEMPMKPELSEHSSSCSFLQNCGKDDINDQKIFNLNNFVGQALKTVNVNLKNAAQQQKIKETQNQMLNDIQIIKQEGNTKVKSVNIQKINKIFGFQSGKKAQQKSMVSDFFTKNNSMKSLEPCSNLSTVQKLQQQSQQKSDIMKHFQQLRDDSFVSALFPKITQNNKVQKETELMILPIEQIKHNSLNSQNASKNMGKHREININLQDYRDISLSCDAISFSKLISASSHSNYLPDLNSFQIQTASKQPNKNGCSVSNVNQKNIENIRPGNVKRIQIGIDSSDSDEEQPNLNQKTSNQFNQSDSELNLQEIQNYNSDEEDDQINPLRKIGIQQKLTPVIEEDLEESQLKKTNTVNLLSVKSFNQNNSKIRSNSNQNKQIQFQLLKDLKLQKNQSQVLPYLAPSQKQDHQKSKITIKSVSGASGIPQNFTNKLRNKVFAQDFSQSNNSSINQSSIKAEKQFINDIKDQIDNLKNRIQSSCSNDSKLFSISSQSKVRPHSDIKAIKIDLVNKYQNKIDNSLSSINQLQSHSLITDQLDDKFGKQHSIIDRNGFNFDELIEQQTKKQVYKKFTDDIDKLKKRMANDAKIGLP